MRRAVAGLMAIAAVACAPALREPPPVSNIAPGSSGAKGAVELIHAADAAWAHNRNFERLLVHGVTTTRPTILPWRRSSSDALVCASGRSCTGIGATLPALTRASISTASASEPT